MNAKANNTKEKVRQLQRKLYCSAKLNTSRKFHSLYDKVYREDTLKEAWKRVKANKGSGGIDQMNIKDVIIYGEEKLLKEIAKSLQEGTYKAQPVRRTAIPKSDGRERFLGLPTIKDKIVQMATKLMIEPNFEADFKDCSYGFRPKRSQHMALDATRKALMNKGYWVIDADIKSYFDHINHEKLMLLAGKRINDRRLLKLIKSWLKAGIMHKGQLVATQEGSPQGGLCKALHKEVLLVRYLLIYSCIMLSMAS